MIIFEYVSYLLVGMVSFHIYFLRNKQKNMSIVLFVIK